MRMVIGEVLVCYNVCEKAQIWKVVNWGFLCYD